MIVRNDISKVREDIEGLIGQHVVIRCNKGKRRTTINKGVLESTYPSVFVVAFNDEIEQTSLKTSFSYTILLYYFIIIITSMLGSMLGINRKKEN